MIKLTREEAKKKYTERGGLGVYEDAFGIPEERLLNFLKIHGYELINSDK